jgi:NAD(P)-dependent dehydrogenase (short-subunit alcohol dehydrogenase family)
MNGADGRPLLLVTGIAEGLGASIARAFATAGHDVLGLARSDRAAAQLERRIGEVGGRYTHLIGDVTQPAALAQALGPHLDRIRVLVHNAQALLIKPVTETSIAEFEQTWRVACLGAFAAAQAVLPAMAARKAGTVILTGATASLRGGARFAGFASAKFALRGLAQSLSREFGPQGIHVAHVVLDGLIEGAQTDRRFGAAQSARMDPDEVARAYLGLALQHPSAWTHELDLRPFSERF